VTHWTGTGVLLGLFALLQLVDGVQTYEGLKRGKGECNRLAAKLMRRMGVLPALAILKVGATLVLVAIALAGAPPWALCVSCSLQIGVVISNARVLGRWPLVK
jgi:hypothetical protein